MLYQYEYNRAGETPKPDLELIRKRLKVAEVIAMEQRK
jgi:hypothetical protein